MRFHRWGIYAAQNIQWLYTDCAFCCGVFVFVQPHSSFDGMCFCHCSNEATLNHYGDYRVYTQIFFGYSMKNYPNTESTCCGIKRKYITCILSDLGYLYGVKQRFCPWLMVHIYQHCNFPSWLPVAFSYQGYDPGRYQSLEIDHMDDSLYLVEACSVTRFHEREVTRY